jgi:hypothetical protein
LVQQGFFIKFCIKILSFYTLLIYTYNHYWYKFVWFGNGNTKINKLHQCMIMKLEIFKLIKHNKKYWPKMLAGNLKKYKCNKHHKLLDVDRKHDYIGIKHHWFVLNHYKDHVKQYRWTWSKYITKHKDTSSLEYNL